ncbi:MAG: hypothetical protein ABIJ21_00455 [Nanoarchaeota archaeon]
MYDMTTTGIEHNVRKAYSESKQAFDLSLSAAIRHKWLGSGVHACLEEVALAYRQMEPLARALAEDSQYGLSPRRGYMWEVTQRRVQFIKLAAEVGYGKPIFL